MLSYYFCFSKKGFLLILGVFKALILVLTGPCLIINYSFVVLFFLLLRFLFCLSSFLRMVPRKSGIFFIFSVLFCLPFFSCFFSLESYFVCMLFLGGLLVGLAYMSSLSSFSVGPWVVVFLLTLVLFFFYLGFSYNVFLSFFIPSFLSLVQERFDFFVLFYLIGILFFYSVVFFCFVG